MDRSAAADFARTGSALLRGVAATRTDWTELEAYNRMKREHADDSEAHYLAAKADFFKSLADG